MYNVLHGPYTLQKSRSSSDVELIVRSDCPQVDFPSRDPKCLFVLQMLEEGETSSC